MSDGSRPGARREGTATTDGATAQVVPEDHGTATRPDAGRGRILLEYVTFGYGVHHLLRVVLLQFAMLFLDVDLFDYAAPSTGSGRNLLVTITWLVASLVFLAVLTALVRQIGRRTLNPRFHRSTHVARSVAGYLVASGVSFLFGYATFVLPGRGAGEPVLPALLPAWLLVVVFATFIAIGYHAQVAVTDHPNAEAITDVVVAWLDSLSWVEEAADSLVREDAYAEFLARTNDVEAILSYARTVEGRRLEADFREWRERFSNRSMLSRELVVEGRGGGRDPGSDRLAAEHEDFLDLRRRLEAIAGAGRSG